MRNKNVLVTGGAGFIGSHLVRALTRAGARVRVLDNLSTGQLENLADARQDIEFQEADIRSLDACNSACHSIDTVFHLAAYVSAPGSVQNPILADAINIAGTLNLLIAATKSGVRRFVFSSSSATYGDTDRLPTPESAHQRPLSPYGIEKLYGENAARIHHQLHGIETISLRYFNVYGPRQNPDSDYAAVIPKFIASLLAGIQPTIFGDGKQTRDFLFVEDIVRANLLAATTDHANGECYNIAGGRAISLNELSSELAKITGSSLRPVYAPERPGDIKHSHADVSRAKSALGFEPLYDLASGLARTVEYYRMSAV